MSDSGSSLALHPAASWMAEIHLMAAVATRSAGARLCMLSGRLIGYILRPDQHLRLRRAWPDHTLPLRRPGPDHELDLQRPGRPPHHIHTDHLGTPLEATNEEGRITWKVTYKTWGNVITEEVTEIQQKLRFKGQYLDQATGLHYNRFRYYEPGVGRFISQDPI